MSQVQVTDGDIGTNARVYDINIAGGDTTEVITHGLVYTPTIVLITPKDVIIPIAGVPTSFPNAVGCYTGTIASGAIAPFVVGPPASGGTVTIVKVGGAPASARIVISRAFTDLT